MGNKFYDHKKIEAKWQAAWEKAGAFKAADKSKLEKYYALCMFPYPSAEGLHVGHPESYTAVDIIARFQRNMGKNVLNPIGWDAFGLPAENYAIKKKRPPGETTRENIVNFTRQLKSLGFSYDWSRQVNTSDPSYYKWTQWLFLQMYKHGLAYKKKAKVNWCDHCQTVLANEQVIDGKCERCGNGVVQKDLAQWFFKITDYAEKLLQGLTELDWPEHIKISQRNWIGRSEGAEIEFRINNQELSIKVFTTRPDTLFGATYMVLAPEHELVAKLLAVESGKWKVENAEEVKKYIEQARKKSELQRTDLAKEKTGIKLEGVKAINPANSEEIPIFVADYVLPSYGTGAIMAVPAHDERDWEFAKKYNLRITPVIQDNKEKTALIIHGTGGSSQKNWYLWLKDKLEENGYRVFVPDLPNSANPKSEEWLTALEQYKDKLGENSIIVGHSLGCPAAWQFIEKFDVKINSLFLVAPTHPDMDFTLINNTHDSNQAKDIKIFTQQAVDWNKIGRLINRLTIILSKDDKYIPINTIKLFSPEYEEIIFKDRGHFNESSLGSKSGKVCPEILEIILRQNGAYIAEGKLINSGEFDGMESKKAKEKITKKVGGEMKVQYRLRDWLVSRQRYWGAPIPIIYCRKCWESFNNQDTKNKQITNSKLQIQNNFDPVVIDGSEFAIIPVPEKDLPVLLPDDVDFKPTGESPLVNSKDFHNVKCPICGASGQDVRRESDTMDTFVCSSWYFLRYSDPHNNKEIFDKKKVKQWLPVDFYIGGAEHANGHLVFARFFTKALKDFGLLNFDEPFLKLRNQGMILGEDNQKMSKSRGNVINPDEVVKEFGADTMRLYEMFMGPLEDTKPWSTQSIIGMRRFLEKLWLVIDEWLENGQPSNGSQELKKAFHKTVKKVTEDIINIKFNTAISAMMILVNQMAKEKKFSEEAVKNLLVVLSPFTPHIAEELWQKIGCQDLVCQQAWPNWDKKLVVDKEIEIAVQVNGKLRARIKIAADLKEEAVLAKALTQTNVEKFIQGKNIVRKIYVPGRLVNIVIK